MSSTLPSPPRPSPCQADKENDTSTPRKVIGWAVKKEVFTFSPATERTTNVPSPSREPRKSILKPSRPPLPFLQEKKRDITPLPDNALSNPHFLEYPVSTIVADDSTLRELTEAYSILAARIRSSVPQPFLAYSTKDPRYPLFQPLRRHADALADSIVRDLGRVFVDPFAPPPGGAVGLSNVEEATLPTPQETPIPKKGGMTEEQVKYARDLSTVTSASIKFLTLAFQAPIIYKVFTKKQLDTILTAALAIPLAESLRSTSARKICGFVITLLQSQRLPEETLAVARDRITFALRRAMDGELGREGKKGATSEALRAVHDLSLFKPEIFVPGFENYLTSVFDNLLTPSCVLRVQAAHALGGFVLGITQSELNFDSLLRNISPHVVVFFLQKDAQPTAQTTILRSLRTALRSPEPAHHAQGPFWAVSVLASLIILFGPALLKDRQLLTAFRTTIDIGLKAKKRVVRAATSMLWGPLIWVWQKWRGSVVISDREGGEDDASECEKVKACFSQMLRLTTHLPIGMSFIGALLGGSHVTCQRQDLLMALFELGGSARQGGESTQRALELLDRLVNAREDDDYYENWTDAFRGKLIPPPLLSVSPGLLTMDLSSLVLTPFIEGIISQQPNHEDVRPLSSEERSLTGVWTRMKDAWVACLEQLELSENDPIPENIIEIWTGLIRMGLSRNNEPATIGAFVDQCANVLTSILANKAIDLRERHDDVIETDKGKDADNGACSAANLRFKLALVRTLWAAMTGVLPVSSRKWVVKPMLRFLVQKHRELVPSSDGDDEQEALSEWAQLWAQVAALSPIDITPQLWGHEWDWDEKTRARVWRGYARGWAEDYRGSWKGAAIVLGLPFRNDLLWDMSDVDLSAWSSLLLYAVDAGARAYISVPDILENVVQCIDRQQIISLSSTLRVADHLLSTFEKAIERCTELPSGLVDLVQEILVTAYPPEPRNKIVAMWMLRSLQMTISNCPAELVIELLETLQDGLCAWLADECALFSKEEYSSEIIPLFQTVLVALDPLPPSTQALQSLSGLFASTLQPENETGIIADERSEALTSFTEFWENSCKNLATPRDGWAEGITQALELAFPKMDCVDASIIVLDSDDELDVLPRTTTPRRRLVSEIPLPPSPSPIRFKLHSSALLTVTPKKTTKIAAMHPRRSDVPRLPALFRDSPPSPTVQRSTRRRSTGGRHQRVRTVSGSHRSSDQTSEEKENVLPPTDVGVVVLGTKRAISSPESSPLGYKKRRVQSHGSDDSADARAVEEGLLDELPFSSSMRAPLADSDVNAYEMLQTPSKRARTDTGSSPAKMIGLPRISPSKRRRMQSHEQPLKVGRRLGYSADEDDDEDDEDDDRLPDSSDVESEEEMSGSSSPIGPFTPQTHRVEASLDIQRDPASDDSVITSSSPTRNIRRLARGSRLQSVARTKLGEMSPLGAVPFASSLRG